MEHQKDSAAEGNRWRHRAEAYLFMQRSGKTVTRTDSEIQGLLHELQVHQIELEMQNTELRRTRDELETSLAMYTNLYNFAPVGYFTLTRDGTIQAVNHSGAALLNSEHSRLLGKRFGQYVIPEDRASFAIFFEKIFAGRDKVEGEVTLLNTKNMPLIVRIEAVKTVSMQECLFALIDITKNKHYEEKLQYLSAHDTLTGLFNRSFFDAELERLMDSRLYPVSVIIADVDDLKGINDTFGHAAGDQMIKLAAKVLRHAVRPEDVVARIGGDEFAILLPQTTSTDEALLRMRQCQETIQYDDAELPLQLSLGAATARNSGQLRDAMLLADLRMYEDKNSNRECRTMD
ncbi:MAG: sensor domain-containing diguanylate cyclase [Pelovirga sp.]